MNKNRKAPMTKNEFLKRMLLVSAIVCFIIAVAFVIWSVVSKVGFFEAKYFQYINWLNELENKIAQIKNIFVIVVVILLMYLIKSTLPLYPISILCVCAGMVLKPVMAFILNILGLMLLYTIRYVTGEKDGGGQVKTLLYRSQTVKNLLEPIDEKNPASGVIILFLTRLLPGFPVNIVSQVFGSIGCYSYKVYILFSLLAASPRVITYILIGRNVTNPFSLKFTVPIIVLSFITGLTLIAIRGVWELIDRRRKHSKTDVEQNTENTEIKEN